ncbi:trypsin-like serine peptidase [Lutibacter citreus]|uniref:trypsin-like serine peptidase n=1 Tax=Lutibacter citreus TaxID=2138210 RepID=UPI000DBE0D5B|nr:trypsin-like peptidase domain-containing protein [Lutibacter citreus]
MVFAQTSNSNFNKIVIIFLLALCISGKSNSQTLFIDQISKEEIELNGFNSISYQDVRRFPFTGSIKNSTAFFISRNFLLTSAHNVTKLPFHSVKKLTLFPSRIGSDKLLDSVFIKIRYRKNIKYPKKYFFYFPWTRKDNDIALIYIPDEILNKNKKLNSLRYLKLLKDSSKKLVKGDTIFCAGYPAEEPYGGKYLMTLDTSIVIKVGKGYFTHSLKTLKGNSGSPIMVKRNGEFYVVGVNSINGVGTYLNNEKLRMIEEWKLKLELRNN